MDNGFESNERLDSLGCVYKTAAEFEEFTGYSPMQILACAALEAENLKGRVSNVLLDRILQVLADIAELLVRNGARLSLEPPPTKRLVTSKSNSAADSNAESEGPVIDAYDRGSMKLESNKKLVTLLGGNDRLKAATKAWQEAKSCQAPIDFVVPFEQDSAFEDRTVPGGSSEKSCAVCWSKFGSIMNRKHRCRISHRYVCDDCSSKRVSLEENDIRVSDGQFLLVRCNMDKAKKEAIEMKRAADEAQIQKMRQYHEKRKAKVDEDAQRESLFEGVMGKAANYLAYAETEGPDSKPAAAAQQVAGMTDSLNQTRNALLERGDKLESLGEKTSQMVDQSAEFAKMAKELQRQSQGFFW